MECLKVWNADDASQQNGTKHDIFFFQLKKKFLCWSFTMPFTCI